MKIVIYGPDNSGKTTLGNQLAELTGGKYLHSLGPVSIEEMKQFMFLNLTSPETVIFDRFPIIEEEVYGNILRGSSRLDDEFLNTQILKNVDLFIYCYPGLTTILNWGEREQMDGVKDNILDIINQYNKITKRMKSEGYNVVEYNFHADDYKALLGGK